MSRRSFCVAVGILAALVSVVGATVIALLRHEPSYYREAAIPAGERRSKLKQEFLSEFSELVSALSSDREGWYGRFSDEQINSYFEEAFVRNGLGERILPEGISDIRVIFEPERLRLAFRYRSGLVNTVISLALRIWLPQVEKNVVAVQLESFKAGAIPISAQWLLEQIAESARQHGMEVNWYRHMGYPVALLRFQADQARPTLQLKAILLEQGRITIHGRTGEEFASSR